MAVAEHLVGRSAELGSFGDLLPELENGTSAAIVLVGEPGIGKTRLLAELAEQADASGHLVLSGSASELEQDLPFWVFVDALDEYVQGLEPRRLAALADDVRTELAMVFPSLSALATGKEVALQHERYRSHRAVRELLELLASTQPVVLVLDDLHWADPASVELLGALLHRPPAAPVLLALAMRPRQMPERLLASVERASRAGTLDRFELRALTQSEAGEFLGDTVAGAEAAELFEESGGNPFYLEQLARMLDRARLATAAPPDLSLGGVRVPATVAAALAEELGLLSDGTRRLLEGAAVAGDPFDPELAAAAAGETEAEAMDALDELLRLDVVRHTDVPRRFRFRHPLVRRAVYESTPGGWRLGAHERCAEALQARGAPASARAHHVELAARQGDVVAVRTLREAGEAAAHRAPASAARWLASALRLLPEDAPAEERVELLLARSRALAAVGQFADSRATLIDSVKIVPEDADALRVRLTVECAGVERLLGRHTEAHKRLERAVTELRDPASPDAVALMIELAADCLFRGDYEGMGPWSVRAIEAANALDDRMLIASAVSMRAMAAALRGDSPVEAQAQGDEAAKLIDELSDDGLAGGLDALVHLATAEMYLDRFVEAGGHAERALSIGRATRQGELFPLIAIMLGTSLWMQGRMAESAQIFDDAVDGARLVDNVQGLAWALLNRSLGALVAGDIETALSTAQESMDLAKSLDESIVSSHAAVAMAGAFLESGHPERAADLLVTSAGGEELRGIPGGWRAYFLELLTRCQLAAGRREEAEGAATACAACADMVGLPFAAAIATRAAAALALDAGDACGAAERAQASAVALDGIGAVYDAAASRMLAGRALAQAGAKDEAAAELERAAAAFDSFGSDRYRAEAERELRKLGRTIHHRTRPGKPDGEGVASLTERELELARLVVDRKTNPEIAATLFLSQKTVETHLRNTFRKLGVSSRVELARAVEHADRTESARSS
jgi:ATP/maltotriose-dependent transcriptional regulator MalT